MQSQNHINVDGMNFANFDPMPDLFTSQNTLGNIGVGMKRTAHDAGLSSDDDRDIKKEEKIHASSSRDILHQQTHLDTTHAQKQILPNGKKTKGRVKIKMEFIDNKLRRYTTFSKRKTGIMKKAYELSTLTGTQVMLLVASETGHVYTFATRKLQPMITSEAGKALIQTCLNSPDPPQANHHHDQRMSATGFEETELTYAVSEDEHKDLCPSSEELLGTAGGSSSDSESSSPPSPASSPPSTPSVSTVVPPQQQALPVQLPPGIVLTTTVPGGVVVGTGGGSVVYATSGGVVYAAAPSSSMANGAPTPLFVNMPPGIQMAQDQGGACSGGQLMSLPMNLNTAILPKLGVAVSSSSSSTQTIPTDLSMHIKREKS